MTDKTTTPAAATATVTTPAATPTTETLTGLRRQAAVRPYVVIASSVLSGVLVGSLSMFAWGKFRGDRTDSNSAAM